MEDPLWLLVVSVVFSSHLSGCAKGPLMIRPLNKTAFAEVGKSFSFQCLFDVIAPLTWFHYSEVLATCKDCESVCKVNKKNNAWYDKIRVTCERNNMRSILTINNLHRLDNTDYITCQTYGDYVKSTVLVGTYDDDLHPQTSSSVPILNREFSLVCERQRYRCVTLKWINSQGNVTAHFLRCFAMHDATEDDRYASLEPGENIICNNGEKKSTFKINSVGMHYDGTVIGCFAGILHLYKFVVHVPVESVEIEVSNKTELLEGTVERFECLVGKSKPSSRIEWIINKESESSINVTSSATTTFNKTSGKFFESRSVLLLNLHRSYKTIQCRATVANLPWVESENLELSIKPDNTVYIIIGCVLFVIITANFVAFLCYKSKEKNNFESHYSTFDNRKLSTAETFEEH